MIAKNQVLESLQHLISNTDIFIVDFSVSASNRIKILIDRPQGLGIADCANISRGLEEALDRDAQDFELEVSSPGAESVFKVPQQYLKNIGKPIEVRLTNQTIVKGKLIDYQADFLSIRPDNQGKKKEKKSPECLSIPLNEISQVKGVVSFTFK
jgi:ribosome maturation factor RimP